MAKTDTVTPYDSVASEYDRKRRAGARTVEALAEILDSTPSEGLILSIGCGTGQYELALGRHRQIIGLDRSAGMLRLARDRMKRCVQGDMAQLPFANDTFSGAYYVQSFHHLGANFNLTDRERNDFRLAALRRTVEVVRSGPIVIVQRDPSQNQAVWYWKYFPEALERKLIIQPRIDLIVEWVSKLGLYDVTMNVVDDPLIEGFYDAEAPLDQDFRRADSDFSFMTPEEERHGVVRLQRAINSGSVFEEIEVSRRKFQEIGGTICVLSAIKRA